MRAEVLIVGAGPTGLVLALWLARLGVKPMIIDKALEPGNTSRALAVQARTLELYRQADLPNAVVARGHRVDAVNLWAKGAKKAHISLGDAGGGLSPYPFMHIFPQDEHEGLLIERLEAMGVRVIRGVELLDFTEIGDRVLARLGTPQGPIETCEAPNNRRLRWRPLTGSGDDANGLSRRRLPSSVLCSGY